MTHVFNKNEASLGGSILKYLLPLAPILKESAERPKKTTPNFSLTEKMKEQKNLIT